MTGNRIIVSIGAVVAFIGAMAFINAPTKQELQQASDQMVTNCGAGTFGCGSVDLLVISGIVIVVVVAVGLLIRLRNRYIGETEEA